VTALSQVEALTRALAARGGEPAPAEPRGRRALYLHPGGLAASAEPAVISTILGSCVSVCLHDPAVRVGGANHFLLPDSGGAPPTPRFGDDAMRELLARVLALGADRRRLTAKVFGGACVVEAFRGGVDGHLGTRNAAAALRFLEAERIPVLAEDTGGRRGRKLLFHTDDGTALVRPL
jgi:chemotaxis protein CheD